MNLDQIDQLRETLRRETQHIEPVGLGAETVQRRGRRRRHRGRAVLAAGAATCVAGLGVAVTQRGPASHSVAVASQAGAATPTLAFRTVDGTVAYATMHFTSASGVTYALSTAPGVAANPADPGQAIYRTSDGENWSTAAQSSTWISDLAEHDGVLYAIGTAPGATNLNDVTYRVGTSHDNGAAWADTDLPFDLHPPSATVPISVSSGVQIARGPSATVALLTEQFTPDLDALVAARAPGHPDATTRQAADGFEIVDFSGCTSAIKNRAAGIAPLARAAATDCTHPPVLGTITWSDMGLRGANDLFGQQVLVSTDGSHWTSAHGPSAGFVRDLVAGSDGFLLLDESYEPSASATNGQTTTTLFRSSDARNWTPVATPAGLDVQAIAGDDLVGVDHAGDVQTSNDGGTTWNTTAIASLLPAGAGPVSGWSTADAGPLGFAVAVGSRSGHQYLLFSSDGVSWKTSDLSAAGAPANLDPMQVTVGADHVAIDYQSAGATPTGPAQITTLLATPTR